MSRKLQVALLVLVVAGAGGWWLVQVTGEPVKVIRAYLEAVNQGDYAKAYGYFSAALKAELSQEDLQAFVEKNAAVMKTSDSSFPNREISNNVATITGSLTGQSGQVAAVRCTLVKEGDRWLIQSFRLRP